MARPKQLGVLSLSDLQVRLGTGERVGYGERLDEIVSYATLADRAGLDVFALGEHHTLDFAVSSPAVALAALDASVRNTLSDTEPSPRATSAHR